MLFYIDKKMLLAWLGSSYIESAGDFHWEHQQACLFVPIWTKSSFDLSNFRKETQLLDQLFWTFLSYVQLKWKSVFRTGFDAGRLLKLGDGSSLNWELEHYQCVFQPATKALWEHLFFLFFISLSPPNVPRRKEKSKHSEPVSPVGKGEWINISAPEQSRDGNNKLRENQAFLFGLRNISCLSGRALESLKQVLLDGIQRVKAMTR